MEEPAQGSAGAAQPSARPDTREFRIPRNAVVVAQRMAGEDRSWIRVDLIDSSATGLGLSSLVPLPPGLHLALSVAAVGLASELILCRIQHCTKRPSGRYVLGVKILERMPGNLNTTRIPDAWRASAFQAAL